MKLQDLGFSPHFQAAFEDHKSPTAFPARVSAVHRDHYRLLTEAGSCDAQLSGKLRHEAAAGALPAVGDWVVATGDPTDTSTITACLPRRGVLQRKRPERSHEVQTIAANLDRVGVVSSLNRDFEPRRIERALAMIWESGAQPLVVLTKRDLCDDCSEQLNVLEDVALGVPVHSVSAHTGEGMSALEGYLQPGSTIALIGSSGAGKSTLINHWLGQPRAPTLPTRAHDDKGRHTTTHRELFVLPGGALLIDTPGMRELALWDASDGVDATFDDIVRLSSTCRFDDCRHVAEPGCAVLAALTSGQLDAARYRNYHKLQRELAHERRRTDEGSRLQHRRELRSFQRQRARDVRQAKKR
jgi:ribosome biogenesis GTPase